MMTAVWIALLLVGVAAALVVAMAWREALERVADRGRRRRERRRLRREWTESMARPGAGRVLVLPPSGPHFRVEVPEVSTAQRQDHLLLRGVVGAAGPESEAPTGPLGVIDTDRMVTGEEFLRRYHRPELMGPGQ